MAQASINFRMDEDLKKEMEATCDDLGINMTTAFTIFAKKMSRERRIPFEVSVDPFYSEQNMARLRAAAARLDAGQGVEHDLIEVEDEENLG
ncbi:MAG: type II toxin-antitoxin system RelB/DinJ family antitoxin [Oscillospiraceae bacterium]|nr:type II toxin-antitoxin system RelB/DinJ family antitoxin [Oscillospiraceae bacterium]